MALVLPASAGAMNLDIIIGEGNADAIAVRHQAAEGSAIEDCAIDATQGLTDIQGGIGSGGSSAGLIIIGVARSTSNSGTAAEAARVWHRLNPHEHPFVLHIDSFSRGSLARRR
jgi:hypothetical protein